MNSQLDDLTNSFIIQREEVFPLNENTSNVINYTIKKITEWMKEFLQDIEFNSETLFFYIFPIGSVTYHKSFPDNPKDFLLCFPGVIKIHQIYESLVRFLNKTGNFQIITILRSRYVPVLEIMISNITFDFLLCFLPYQYCLTKKPVFNLRNPPQCLLDKMDLKSIFALNSLRNSLLIRDYLGDLFSVYQETLLHLKKWAIFKLIYFKSSSKFLNGTSLSIMLACIFRKTTTVTPTVMSILYIFFRYYADLNWSKRTISINLDNFIDNMREIVMKNPELMTPKNNIMTILTPAMPYQNCTKNINQLALDRIVHYFKEAYYILETISWKSSLESQLMVPLTLMDFISYDNSVKTEKPQIVLISIMEEKLIENKSLFCEFEELIKMKLKSNFNNENVLYYPLAFRNVVFIKHNNQLRIRHFLLLNYNTNINCAKSDIGNITDKYLPNGMKYTIESIADNDFRIISLNFDNMEKIIRLLYTGP